MKSEPPNFVTMDEWLYEDFFCRKEAKKREDPAILIVEDDESYRPIWREILAGVCPRAHVDWVPTEEAAERLIRNRVLSGQRYDLVIADVYLAGQRTGIDLWRRYGIAGTQFLLVTGQNKRELHRLFGSEIMPPLLCKPLEFRTSRQALEKLLEAA